MYNIFRLITLLGKIYIFDLIVTTTGFHRALDVLDRNNVPIIILFVTCYKLAFFTTKHPYGLG
jgi:hypothetical protein